MAITKKRASDAFGEVAPIPGVSTAVMSLYDRGVLDALDRAGAFVDEAALAEIGEVVGEIMALEPALAKGGVQRPSPVVRAAWKALRLASACRAAGLVK